MNISEIKPGIRYVGVNDRTTTRFEGLWSLPHGVSYNSYLLLGDKVALMDTVEESFGSRFLQNIERELDGRTIDYLIVNHVREPEPLVIGADVAPRLPRHADRRQRQDPPDARRLLRHRRQHAGGQGGRHARPGRRPLARVLLRTDGALARR